MWPGESTVIFCHLATRYLWNGVDEVNVIVKLLGIRLTIVYCSARMVWHQLLLSDEIIGYLSITGIIDMVNRVDVALV
jgi:hypothetical protein